MIYYKDSEDGSYFYLEESSKHVHDNNIFNHIDAHTSSTPFGLFPAKLTSYPDELFDRLAVDNQI